MKLYNELADYELEILDRNAANATHDAPAEVTEAG